MSIIWAYLQFRVIVWLLRLTGRLLLFAALVAVLVAAAPLTLVAAVGLAGAWLRGWPPARLRRAATWSLPMTAVYLAGRAVQARTWQAFALAPVRDYLAGWHAVAVGQVVTAFVLAAPVAVPVGLAAASGVVGVADLRPGHRPGRQDRHRARCVRRPAMETAGPRGPRPDHCSRDSSAGRPARAGGDGCDDPRGRAPLAAHLGGSVPGDGTASGGDRRVRQREDEPDDPPGPAGTPPPAPPTTSRARRARCWWCWTAKAAPTPGRKATGPAACCTPSAPPG